MNAHTPTISIIIGVFNMKDTLPMTLDSVIKQSYPHYELIIMDGGSTDGTLEVIEQYQYHISHFESGRDGGHCAACNKAIGIATGDLILLLNADDVLLPNALAKIADAKRNHPDTGVIACGAMIATKSEDGSLQIDNLIHSPGELDISLSNILFGLPLINAKIFDRSLFQEFGLFKPRFIDDTYYISNDREFLLRLALKEIKASIIPKPLYLYLAHPGSITFSEKNLIKIHREHIHLAEQLLNNNTLLTAQQKHLIQKWRLRETIALCYFLCKTGDLSGANKLLLSSFRQQPFASLLQLIYLTYRKTTKPLRDKLFRYRLNKLTTAIKTAP